MYTVDLLNLRMVKEQLARSEQWMLVINASKEMYSIIARL